MKQYREYAIYLMKSVCSSSIVYVCFYTLCLILFGIHLPAALFLSGTASVLCSFISGHHNKNHPLANGTVFSLAAAIIFYLLGSTPMILFISFSFDLLLWRIGWSLQNSGIQYELYREQFITGLRLLIAAMLISIMFKDMSAISMMSRYSVIYLILGLLLLRNSREFQYVRFKIDKHAGFINLLANLFIIIMLLLITSDGFLSAVSLFSKAAWNLFDRLLEEIIYAAGLVIGFILTPLINFLKHTIHYKDNISLNNNNSNQYIQNPPAGSNIPPAVYLILKIIIIAAAAAVIIKLYNSYSKRKKNRDYSEEKEFIFNIDEVSRSIKKNLSSTLNKVREIFNMRPVSIRDKIRYIYTNFLKLSIKKGIYTKISETPEEIKVKSQSYTKENAGLGLLTDVYEKARYSKGSISEADLDNAKSGYLKIKDI